jgi:hypothetical protein
MLLNISFEELKDFFKIILWISVPAVLIASTIAVFLHYRKKKKEGDFGLAYAMPEDRYTNTMAGIPKQEQFEKTELTQLLRKYELDLQYHTETHEQLRQEFNELEESYMQLLAKNSNGQPTATDNELVSRLQNQLDEKDLAIQQLEEMLSATNSNEAGIEKEKEWERLLEEQESLLANKQSAIEQQENELNHTLSQLHLLKGHVEILENEKQQLNRQLDSVDKHAPLQLAAMEKKWQEEKAELSTKLQLTNSKLETIQKENEWLNEQAKKINTVPSETEESKLKYEQLHQIFISMEKENQEMKSKMSDQQYMEDIVQEKKMQIEFLQNQLDQRIKSFREMEKQYESDSARLKLLDETAKKYEEELQVVSSILRTKEQEFTHLRDTSEKTIGSKITHIELLEREMGNMQQQNNLLSVSLEETNKNNAVVSKQLTQQTQRISELESKLEVSSQLFIKIYKELSRSFEGTMGNYPFVNGNGNGASRKIEDNNLIEILSSHENPDVVK